MSLLAHDELCELIDQGVITKVGKGAVNSSSIDLTLGNKILYEKLPLMVEPIHTVFLSRREDLSLQEHNLEDRAFFLDPGSFVLAHTEQVFYLPNNISAEYKLKSSLARSGLEHLNAGWCDAGWNGSVLTLELKNMTLAHSLALERGMPIGQIVFFKHAPVPDEKSYSVRGRYNNDMTVKGIKE